MRPSPCLSASTARVYPSPPPPPPAMGQLAAQIVRCHLAPHLCNNDSAAATAGKQGPRVAGLSLCVCCCCAMCVQRSVAAAVAPTHSPPMRVTRHSLHPRAAGRALLKAKVVEDASETTAAVEAEGTGDKKCSAGATWEGSRRWAESVAGSRGARRLVRPAEPEAAHAPAQRTSLLHASRSSALQPPSPCPSPKPQASHRRALRPSPPAWASARKRHACSSPCRRTARCLALLPPCILCRQGLHRQECLRRQNQEMRRAQGGPCRQGHPRQEHPRQEHLRQEHPRQGHPRGRQRPRRRQGQQRRRRQRQRQPRAHQGGQPEEGQRGPGQPGRPRQRRRQRRRRWCLLLS